jgi:sortase A
MRRVIGGVGRALITVGLLILLFVGYQLWGTGIYEARAQSDLKQEFQQRLREQKRSTPTTTAPAVPAPTTTTLPPLEAPPIPIEGEPIARIRIPRIGVDKAVVEGTTVEDLRKAPGHYVGTPLPGEIGNAGIAGHRTTYGAPFGSLDQLTTGDEIFVQTLTGNWRYVLSEDPFEVTPNQVEVLEPRMQVNPLTGQEEEQTTLTLTTCHPRYSAAKRLIVFATLDDPDPPAPAPPPPPQEEKLSFGLTGERESRTPTVISGIVAALIGLLWWLWFHRHPGWMTWITGVIPFAISLAVFYYFLERVIPNNY